MQIIKKEKLVEHPLESVFDIEPCTTPVEYNAVVPSELTEIVGYDQKDNEIEQQYEEIYAVAMGQVEVIADEMERVEGKYKARVGEVTATMLNVALGAARAKADMKIHKDKLGVTAKNAGTPNSLTQNNNFITADRNEILKALMAKQDK